MSAIDDKYHALGGAGGFLGHPQDEGAGSHEMETRSGRGRFRDFQGGTIYWSPNTGPHEVHGDIRTHWAGMGWENSFLHYPTSDELPDGEGRFSQFQGGSIHWTPIAASTCGSGSTRGVRDAVRAPQWGSGMAPNCWNSPSRS